MSIPPSAATAVPRAHLLSNGRYTTMLTDAGSGWSRWCGRALTRWREDPTRDAWGSYLLLRDADSGSVWSAAQQPIAPLSDGLATDVRDGLFRITRRHDAIETRLVVAVAADCDAELRHLTITNHDRLSRVIEVTSYAEPVLGSAATDASHPAFSKLFVRTEWVAEGGVLLATRRRQTPDEMETWFAQVALVEGQQSDTSEYQSERAGFLGRGRTLRHAAALQSGEVLEGVAGDVLDAVISLRRRVRIAAGATVRIAFWNCVGDSREKVLALAKGVAPAEHCGHVIKQARACAIATRAKFALNNGAAERSSHLLGALLYANPDWRASPDMLRRASGGAPVLWSAGISGDRPVALLNVDDAGAAECVHELLSEQRYWQFMGMGVDVVLLEHSGRDEADTSDNRLTDLVEEQSRGLEADTNLVSAEVFHLHADRIDEALHDGLMATARVVLSAREWPAWLGRFSGSGEQPLPMPSTALAEHPTHTIDADSMPTGGGHIDDDQPALLFENGYGGFSPAGDEYVIRTDGDHCTPLPWSNVVANPDFGFIATAQGGGHTFSCNSQQNPLTPWPNDPVSDEPCEVLYLRDADTGAVWSATPRPIPGPATKRVTHHGRGWTSWSHVCDGLDVELLQCVPVADCVKVSRLRIHNGTGRARTVAVTAYLQWALGPNGTVPGPHVVTSQDPRTGALFAVNPWRSEFAERVAFADMGATVASFTCDRGEFLGAFGSLDDPVALRRSTPLSGWHGAGRDPCAAMQCVLGIAPGASVELRVVLGDAASENAARDLILRARGFDVDAVMGEIRQLWDSVTSPLQVETPDSAMDLLLNHWLLYQVLSCRVWARTAYYQSSGAYGFRDQLQDVMALCISRPDVAREHLLRAASRQFVEGDVQHWWLPPAGQGIRTRMTDDRLWLPYSTLHYMTVSGDTAVLDAVAPFLEGPALQDDQHDAFFTPTISATRGSLYEHCARAVDASLALGPHQLPLIGTGDWNDGMNAVGEQGTGESIWLGWFLLDVITRLTPIAQGRGDAGRADHWCEVAGTVKAALEGAGWDGDWYRRGYYDDGTPLGSASQEECRIDAIAQSWAVMSGAADPDRARRAMDASDRELVDHRHHLMRLFTPPFEDGPRNPGYIKAYPPGVRENGGQYTHGCIWSIFAWAELGEGGKVRELLDFFNPIRHTSSRAAVAHFKAEPYVSCADVYSVGALAGRGGWTWYSGSAGWLYRAGIEALLGFHLRGDALLIHPCIPGDWPGFTMTYRYRGSVYRIRVENPAGVSRGIRDATLDGAPLALSGPAAMIPLRDDGQQHRVDLTMGNNAEVG